MIIAGRNRQPSQGRRAKSQPKRRSSMSPAAMYFPLRFGNTHEHLSVFDGNPTSEYFHDILKVGIENNFAHAINEGGRRGM